MIYMPLLEETGHVPSERYAHAPEIRAHCDRIARQYLVRRRLFTPSHRVESQTSGGCWHLHDPCGEAMSDLPWSQVGAPMIEAERVALRRRYARERDKRLRPDGNDQYLELKGQFSRLPG